MTKKILIAFIECSYVKGNGINDIYLARCNYLKFAIGLNVWAIINYKNGVISGEY